MTTLRNRRKLAAVWRKIPENTRNNQLQKTLDPEMAQEYISQVSEEIDGRVTKKLSQEFSRTESRILRALSKLDELLLNPQVRTCSVAVPGTSRNSNSENREPTGDRSLDDPRPEARFSSHHSGNLNSSEVEECPHSVGIMFINKMTVPLFTVLWSRRSWEQKTAFRMRFQIFYFLDKPYNMGKTLSRLFPINCQQRLGFSHHGTSN